MTRSLQPGPLRLRWSRLPGREKNLILLAAVALVLLLVWKLSVSPSLATLRTSTAQSRQQAAQLQQMLALQQQAQALQKQPPLGSDAAFRALGVATKQNYGNAAQLTIVGDRANVTLKNAPADALAEWLVQARTNARSVPLQAQLTRSTAPVTPPAGSSAASSATASSSATSATSAAAASDAGLVAWSGVLVMGLPAR